MAGFDFIAQVSPDRRREIRFAVLLLIVPVLLLAVAEISARAVRDRLDRDLVDWAALSRALAVPTEDRLYLFEPGTSYGNLQINSLGLRSPEVPIPAPENVLRIAFLGDSVTLGASLPEALTYPAITARLLDQDRPGCTVDHATFAGPSYSTTFIAEHWPPIRDSLRPDVTVVLAGGPTEIISRLDDGTAGAAAIGAGLDLAVFDLAQRFLQRYSLAQFLPDVPAEPRALEQSLTQTRTDTARIVGSDPALLLGARGTIRRADEDFIGLSDALRDRLRGAAVTNPVAFTDETMAMMASVARGPDQRFADLLDQVPPNEIYYRDAQHLTREGHERLARLLVEELSPLLPDC